MLEGLYDRRRGLISQRSTSIDVAKVVIEADTCSLDSKSNGSISNSTNGRSGVGVGFSGSGGIWGIVSGLKGTLNISVHG